jgi:putative Mn2+ efflux pump MntP
MQLATVLLLAVGLAMDAMAVALARGFAARSLRTSHVLRVALLFGGFQAAMPALGLLVGRALGRVADDWDHWLAFVLLAAIGLKMIKEGWSRHEDAPEDATAFELRALLPLAIATSVDALAAGITLPTLKAPPAIAIGAIGVVTAVLSALGVVVGHRFGAQLGPRMEVLGGVVLIGLAVKTLVAHLS